MEPRQPLTGAGLPHRGSHLSIPIFCLAPDAADTQLDLTALDAPVAFTYVTAWSPQQQACPQPYHGMPCSGANDTSGMLAPPTSCVRQPMNSYIWLFGGSHTRCTHSSIQLHWVWCTATAAWERIKQVIKLMPHCCTLLSNHLHESNEDAHDVNTYFRAMRQQTYVYSGTGVQAHAAGLALATDCPSMTLQLATSSILLHWLCRITTWWLDGQHARDATHVTIGSLPMLLVRSCMLRAKVVW